MKKYLAMAGMAVLITGCSSTQNEKVTDVSKWTLQNVNGCWSLTSDEQCCSKMVKVLNPDNCKCNEFSEAQACVSFPSDAQKRNGTEYYRVEMKNGSGDKKIYWHTTNQLATK